MADGGRREAIDAAITAWEHDLERLRVVLANAGEAAHAEYHAHFVTLYGQKEVVKSRWELLRGTYQPATEAVRRFEEAFRGMESAWDMAQPMRTAVLGVNPIGAIEPQNTQRSQRTTA